MHSPELRYSKSSSCRTVMPLSIPRWMTRQPGRSWLGTYLSLSPAPVSPEFCPRCQKVHWYQNQWGIQKDSHFVMSLLASSFLYSSLFTERATYICRQFNLDQAVICKTSAIDYAHANFLKRMWARWDWGGGTVSCFGGFQQDRRPNLFMLNSQNANNKLSDVT